MNKQELFQKFCESELENFTKVLKGAAEEVIHNISNDYLPHVGEDAECNVSHRTNEVVRMLLEGKYSVEYEGYLTLNEPYAFINVGITNRQWDDFRKELIKIMPACPKDLEIESLKEQLKLAYERRY